MFFLSRRLRRSSLPLRSSYHDESFGYRAPRLFVFPDYTPAQLVNRATNAALLRYVDAIRIHGHRAASIDPLALIHRMEVKALDPARYGLFDENKTYNIDGIIWTDPHVESQGQGMEGNKWWSLSEITQHLRATYVQRIGYEFMHSPSKSERLWFSHHLESTQTTPAKLDQKRIHGLLARSEILDQFLQQKFPNLKRYGLEGGESMLPALDALFSSAGRARMSNIILAMPHRGRLNLLTNLLDLDAVALFHKIRGGAEIPEDLGAEGDVLSHLVSSTTIDGVKVSLLPNPSHLEAIGGVALGKARAKQYSLLKTSPDDCTLGDRVMCVQIHGDASFAGQGIVMESLGLSNLPHFSSGGSLHLVIDNNIGYTTPAMLARSSTYCSDVGKMINAPVLHVNGDYPEDVVKAMDVAFRYREYFRKDIIVDLLVYRRWGHNELDLPSLTSPLMYEQISARKSVPQLYEQSLIGEQVLTIREAAELREGYKQHLGTQLAKVEGYVPKASMLEAQWSDMVWPALATAEHEPSTGVEPSTLARIGEASVRVQSSSFLIHPKLQRHRKNRLNSLSKGLGIDWATAEALAFGSLMEEGYDVRVSGQDCGRGTFSQRHAMLVDQKTERVVIPLNEELNGGRLELANSSLSEMAILAFEYGQSWERPDLLPIWEAQFGDFFNGAQIIIDQFVASAETKWLKQSGLVMLLPHGLDGAGPEHSSSRIERFLQLSNDRYSPSDNNNINMHIVYPTTPAQYFHLLRRQMKRNYRKPLIVAGPKGLLRLAAAASSLKDMGLGTAFKAVLPDPDVHGVKRAVFCSGKIYYELLKARPMDSGVALVRIEELCPFPFEEICGILRGYKDSIEVCWVQEEPRNQGAWGHVRERMEDMMQSKLRYIGRSESAVPAPGIAKMYKKQQEQLVRAVFEETE